MIVALFEHEAALLDALRRLRAANVQGVETFTPAPLTGESKASPIPAIILCAAIIGAAGSFGLQSFSSIAAYAFDIGDRPDFAWVSFGPTTFENAVLVALAAGFLAFMIINRLPRLYDPVDEADCIRTASSDGWVLAVRSTDPATIETVGIALRGTAALHVEQVPS